MPVTATIPVTGDYREIILPAGYADNVRCLLVGGDHLFLCTDTNPGSLLKVRKDDFSVHSVVTFSNDTEHKNAIDAVYVPGSSLANDRVYVLFAWGPATPGLLMISQVNPNADSNNAPTIVNEDYVREEDFTPGVAGCLATDNTYLYVLSGYVDPIRIATVRLSDAQVFFSPALSPHANGWVMRTNAGRLYAVGKTLDEFGDTWVKRINPVLPPANPYTPSVETAITITNGTDFYLMSEDIGVSADHLWIGMRGNPAGFGKIKKVTQSGLTVTDFPTGIQSAARTVKLAGSFIWALFDNGKAARINPSTGDVRIYTLNDGQGFQSLINTDADAFLYTAWYQTGTKIARYRIPPDMVASWPKTLGVGGAVSNCIVAVDTGSNVLLVAGYTGTPNFGGQNLPAPARYGSGLAIVKYDSSGTHQWSHGFGGVNDGSTINIRNACADPSGNLVVVGSFLGTINLGGNNLTTATANFQDCFIVKYNANGGHIWSAKFGGNSDDALASVIADSSGNIIAAGTYRGTMTVGAFTLVAGFSQEMFMVKFAPDASGTVLWATDFFCSASVNPYCMTIDRSDNVFVAGTFTGAIDLANDPEAPTGGGAHRLEATAPGNNTSIFLAKFTISPNLSNPNWNQTIHQWSRRFGGTTFSTTAGSIAVASTGDIVLTGSFNSDVNLGNGLITGSTAEAFLSKYSASDGTFWWQKILGSFCGAKAAVCDSLNNILLAGNFTGATNFGGSTTYNVSHSGDANGYFIKYSPGSPGVPGVLQAPVLIFNNVGTQNLFQASPATMGLDRDEFFTGGGIFTGIGTFAGATLNASEGNAFLVHGHF